MKKYGKYYWFEKDERTEFQDCFMRALDKMSINPRSGDGFENDVFIIKPHNWRDEEEGLFWFKPTGLMVHFYKYPLRSARFTKKVSLNQFKQILEVCKASYGMR